MPQISDWDPNDEKQGGGFGADGSSGSSSGGGALFGGASPQHEQQYTPWDRFTSANSDVSSRSAGNLADNATADAKTAQGDLTSAQGAFQSGVDSNYNAATSRANASAPKTPAAGAGAFGGTSFGQPAPTASTPWASLTGSAPGAAAQANPLQQSSGPAAPRAENARPQPTPAALPSATPGGPTPNNAFNITGTPRQLTADAVANGPKGPADLEAAAGADAWGKLVGDTKRANSEANALGNEAGVQAQLQKNGDNGIAASGFDAALINGAGQQAFQGINSQYGGDKLINNAVSGEQASQDAWAKLQGDTAAAKQRQADDAARAQQLAAQRAWKGVQPDYGDGSDDRTEHPNDAVDFRNVVAADNGAHTATWDDVGKAGATKNASNISDWKWMTSGGADNPGGPGQDAWQLSKGIMKGEGIPDDQQSKYWDEFRSALPEGMRNFVNAMVAGNGLGATYFGNNHASSAEDWAWFQGLFNAWLKSKKQQTTGATHVSGGLMSESTKPPK